MRKFWMIVLIIALFFFLSMYAGNNAAYAEKKVKIGICFTAVGPGDLSFNNMLYSGSIEVQSKYDVEFAYQTAATDTTEGFREALAFLVEQEGCDLVMTLGYQAKEAVDQVVQAYPGTQFVLFDVTATQAANAASVIYAQHEGAFVAGALAAYFTKTGKLGFIGGVDINILKAFLQGFQEGITYVNPAHELFVEYCSLLPDFSGFSIPEKGYEIANKMYARGVDIIFSGAGASGPGIIQAAMEHEKYVIGTDSNQDYMAPGFVLTSLMKRLDVAMVDLCEQFIQHKYRGGTVYEYGLHNRGISLSPMEFTKEKIPEEVLKELESIQQKIIRGEIVVTNILKQPQ